MQGADPNLHRAVANLSDGQDNIIGGARLSDQPHEPVPPLLVFPSAACVKQLNMLSSKVISSLMLSAASMRQLPVQDSKDLVGVDSTIIDERTIGCRAPPGML